MPPTRRGCGQPKILPSLAPGKALYASANRQGRSFRGTPKVSLRRPRRLGRCPRFPSRSRPLRQLPVCRRTPRPVDQPVRRRIDDFETQIGSTLFMRDVHGAHLTDEGAGGLRRRTDGVGVVRSPARAFDSDAVGRVQVAVGEDLGTFWLAPRLVEFQQSFPNILVDLQCAMHSADVSRHEAEVAIELRGLSSLDVKTVKLGRLHVMLFASQKISRRVWSSAN